MDNSEKSIAPSRPPRGEETRDEESNQEISSPRGGGEGAAPLPGEGLGVRLLGDNYDDIIHLPHHVSTRHAPMSMLSRAAQFAPFAALTGYDDAVREEGRLTDDWRGQGDAEGEELNRAVAQLRERMGEQPRVKVTFFRPDERKRGGAYSVWSGRVKRIDEHERRLCLTDGHAIPMDFITQIETE